MTPPLPATTREDFLRAADHAHQQLCAIVRTPSPPRPDPRVDPEITDLLSDYFHNMMAAFESPQ